jgi:hypothetical protein
MNEAASKIKDKLNWAHLSAICHIC